MANAPQQTPMMKQYMRFKAEHPDAILFFHMGDFYEAFYEDAELLAREVDIVLTSRNGIPMAGVPVRRGDAYVSQLLKKGHKVAVCQQVEDPRTAKGLVKRDVVRIVTPGTAIDDSVLDSGANNYLAAVHLVAGETSFGLAFLDLSTGEFACAMAESIAVLRSEIERKNPSEVLVPEEEGRDSLKPLLGERTITVTPTESYNAAAVEAEDLGFSERALQAAGAILAYVTLTQKTAQQHVRALREYRISDRMDLDPFTVSSLELVKPLHEGQERGTLLRVVDRTVTGMGRRLLRRRLLAPFVDRQEIEERLDVVESLVNSARLRDELRDTVGEIHDLERLIGKLGVGRMRPYDLGLLLRSMTGIPTLDSALRTYCEAEDLHAAALDRIQGGLAQSGLRELCDRFSDMLVDQPAVDSRDGGVIRDGYSEDLDVLRRDVRDVRAQLTELEAAERERTGISSLKVGFNRVFGYYIEVTKTKLDKVPAEYVRRQTLANAERFVTDELKALEDRVASGDERAKALEVKLFEDALAAISDSIGALQEAADAIAELDVLLSMADVAHRSHYVRPTFTEQHRIVIDGGRHPVVERIEEFVPNDLELGEDCDVVILTGPNMAGKSVYLRQTALICLMAQAGSFVPADRATLPIVDRVFARVGASDMVASGISTFMMEMLETAAILERATARSLIILDEMGRGTSTFDGVSIAWAVASELARSVRAKTLFATHYQELTRLAEEIPNVANMHVAVKEVGRDIVFLHRVTSGKAKGSYGVHVARLAGLPQHVTDAADRILEDLLLEAPLSSLGHHETPASVLPLFGSAEHPVVKRVRETDPNRLTPIEALQLLADLKEQADAFDETSDGR